MQHRQEQSLREWRLSARPRLSSPVRLPFLVVGVGAGLMVGALAAIVLIHRYLLLDATVERGLQAIDLGPLTMVFPFFSWIGGPGGTYMEIAVVLLVVVLNLRALPLAVAVLAGGTWYE